jgi:hypothetical protein
MAASPVPDLPLWTWNLVIAIQRHEDNHAKDATCLDGVLSAIPADVRTQAAAITAYIQQASGDQIADLAAKTWDDMVASFASTLGLKAQPAQEAEAP